MALACWMCSWPGSPCSVSPVNPNHIYYALAIVIVALLLAVLPFLLGYRLGPRIPYSAKNHFKFFVLFAIVLLSTGSLSFGGILAALLSWLDINLILILGGLAEMAVVGAGISEMEYSGLFILPAAIAGHALYTWIFALIDRPLIKPEKNNPERNMKNGQTD